jgi:hypothetical protein
MASVAGWTPGGANSPSAVARAGDPHSADAFRRSRPAAAAQLPFRSASTLHPNSSSSDALHPTFTNAIFP